MLLIQAQFRNQFIQDFKHQLFTGAESVLRAAPAKFEPTMVSVCNSIAAEHLRVCGYEYTLSVFYPESGQCKDKVSIYGVSLKCIFNCKNITEKDFGLSSFFLAGFHKWRTSSPS